MRLIIDIDSNTYRQIKDENMSGNPWEISNAISHGTPIPDNATRYDIAELFYGTDDAIDLFNELRMEKDWWNAPYQKGGKE